MRAFRTLLFLGAASLGLSGCVAYPDGSIGPPPAYGPGYGGGYGPAYGAPPPVYVAPPPVVFAPRPYYWGPRPYYRRW